MESALLSRRRLLFLSVILLWMGQTSALAQIAFGPVRAYKGAVGRMVSADLDHDGDIDLVTGDVGSTRVSVLLNNGDGTFASPVDYSIPSGTRALIAADLNGDTHVDLVLARAGPFPTGDGIISVLLNNGSGVFGSVLDYSLMVTPVAGQQLTPLSLAAGDFDSDGNIDLAAAGVLLNQLDQPGYFSIMLNVGNDGLGLPLFDPSVNVDATQSFSKDIVAGDFDNDTDADLAIVSSLSNRTNSVSVILSNGDGTFGLVRNERLSGTATAAAKLVVGDINGDTYVDFITINAQHSYSVLLNLDGGTDPAKAGLFKDQGQFPLGSQALPATDIPGGGAALRDLDGDTDLDLIVGLVGDSGPGSLAVFINPGTGVFSTELTYGPCLNYGSLAAEDFDGDGDIDVASGNVSIQRTLVLLNELVPAVPPIGDPADADGDGVLDCDDGCPFDPTKSVPGVCGCAGSFIASSCDDGDACTTGDVCSSGACVSGSPTDCNDNNVCTDDSCDSVTGCLNAPVLDRLCDDESVCTQTDTCNALGECVGSNGLNCNDSNVCTDDSCDPVTGCSNLANTAPCDDNDACTTGDVCSSSACVSGSPTNCNDSNVCTDDSCDTVTGCLNAPVIDRACDDGNACTLSDTCDASGVCIGGAGPDCDDTNVCTDDSCDSATGCINTANTAPCDDGDACTTGDVCSSSACVSGSSTNCDDSNGCTDDSCDSITGCLNAPVVGRPCDDGNACTDADTCDALGVCIGGSGPDCNDSNVCTDDSCDSVTGCLNAPVLDRLCDDESVCTQTDTCNALGECVGSDGLNCNDKNVCTDDSCDSVTGCSNVANTAPCDDGDACTTGDVCSSSACVSGSPTNCNDSNVCTDDSCDAVDGCLNTPVVGRACDDASACTESDTCDALGSCVGGALNCNDTNVCTDDTCDAVIGCLNTPVTGRLCDDESVCTQTDTCNALGECVGSDGLNCNDSNECTDDSCDIVSGCLNTPVIGRACDDSSVCTLADACDAIGACIGSADLNCDDTNECTDDSCDALLGCQNVSVPGRVCNDGRDCTTNDVCDSAGDCVGDDSACTQVPTVSSWGLMIMILLLFIAGTLLLTNIRNTTITE